MNRKKEAYRVLAKDVIAVAIEGGCGDWAAYIGAVKGYNHDEEAQGVKESGTKLPRELAEFLFPEFRELAWRS